MKVIATGLDNPRKIFLGPDSSVYVVAAGTGGNTQAHRCLVTCVGDTGSVVRIEGGDETPVLTGLGSYAEPNEQEAEGPAAVVVDGGTYYVLMQDMEINAQGVNTVGLAYAGDLVSTPAGKVSSPN